MKEFWTIVAIGIAVFLVNLGIGVKAYLTNKDRRDHGKK